MIQYHQDLQDRASKFNSSIAGQFGQIQKIYSTSHFICINLRFPGKSRNIYFGRGGGYEGFWEGNEKPKSVLRVRDRFLDYLRKYLISGLLTAVRVDEKDRALILEFQRFGQKNYFMIFWSGRKSYFLTYTYIDNVHPRLFLSWQGEIKSLDKLELGNLDVDLLALFDEVGRTEQTATGTRMSKEIDELLADEETKVTLDKRIKKKENFLTKKIKNIKGDLEKVEIYHELESLAKDPELDLEHSKELQKSHFSIKFKTEEGHFQKLNSLYNRIKKLKSAKTILQKREIDTTNELLKAKSTPDESHERVVDKIVGPVWKTDKKDDKPKSPSSISNKNLVDEFSLNNKSIGIGLSAHGNDFLRSTWGKANHLWFHLDGTTSAHLAVKIDHFSQLSTEELSIIASMLWDYSTKSTVPTGSLIPLLFTQIKNLKGIKGVPGSVNFKKEKHLSIAYLPEWKTTVVKFSY